MFKINKIHDHQGYKVVHEMADYKDFNVGEFFIKNGKDDSYKGWYCHLTHCSVCAVKNPKQNRRNKYSQVLIVIYLFNSSLDVAPHQQFFNRTRRKTGKDNQ